MIQIHIARIVSGAFTVNMPEVNRNKINIFNHIRKLKLKRSEEEGERE